MSSEEFKRKLTAIMSADVAGYSRLMGDNEAATVKTLEAYKQVMFSLIKQHRGRVVDSPGDNLLAEFASVVDAVQCGVAVQNELKARNAYLPENRRMRFRIGINLGDVIEEGDRIYGDGVNIAARLESLSDPGGICVSRTAFDHIETKLPLGYEYLGEQTVKNIAKPIGAYRVVLEPRITVVGAGEKKVASKWLPLPLTIAVVLILLVGAGAIWHFAVRTSSPPLEKADQKRTESQLAAQLEAQKQSTEQAERAGEDAKREALLQAQKQVAEETLRHAQEETSRLAEERKRLEAERRASDRAKKQADETRRRAQAERGRLEEEQKRLETDRQASYKAKQEADETLRRAQAERNRLEEGQKQAEGDKHALEATKQQAAVSPTLNGSQDGTYSGQLCNQWTKPPFCRPVPLVVRNAIAEGSWVSRTKKRARAHGTIFADGQVWLNLEAWDPSGNPVDALLHGRIVDGRITASGLWNTGGGVSGDWSRMQIAAAATAVKATPALTSSHDGTYSGQLCYPVPNKPPFCWPVPLVVRNGIAEGSWISPAKKTAKARGTVDAEGELQLNLETWNREGTPVEAIMTGRIVDGMITASGQWSTGGSVFGDWKRTP
jgi:class 3 adenylate cyclase